MRAEAGARILATLGVALLLVIPRLAGAQCFDGETGFDPRWDPDGRVYSPTEGASWQREELSFEDVSGAMVTRGYWLFEPPSAPATARRLVLVFHGGGAGFLDGAHPDAVEWGMNAVAEERGWLVAYPEARYDPEQISCGLVHRDWNDGRYFGPDQPPIYGIEADVDDVGFVRALVLASPARHGVDPAKVHALGASNGGMMVHRLVGEPRAAALFSSIVTNLAPLPGASADPTSPAFAPLAPVHALLLFGGDDAWIPGSGGRIFAQPIRVATTGGCAGSPTNCDRGLLVDDFAGVGYAASRAETVTRYEEANGVSSFAQSVLPDLDGDGRRMQRWIATDADRAADLVLYEMEGGGHRNWGQSADGDPGDYCLLREDCSGGLVSKMWTGGGSFDLCWVETAAAFLAAH